MIPLARIKDISAESVGNEVILKDSRRSCSFRLNPIAARVWQHSNGRNTVNEIAALIALEFRVTPTGEEDPRGVVWLVLEELERDQLLQEYLKVPRVLVNFPNLFHKTRRQFVATNAKMAVAALFPFVTALAAAGETEPNSENCDRDPLNSPPAPDGPIHGAIAELSDLYGSATAGSLRNQLELSFQALDPSDAYETSVGFSGSLFISDFGAKYRFSGSIWWVVRGEVVKGIANRIPGSDIAGDQEFDHLIDALNHALEIWQAEAADHGLEFDAEVVSGGQDRAWTESDDLCALERMRLRFVLAAFSAESECGKLAALVQASVTHQGIQTSLLAKLDNACRKLQSGRKCRHRRACGHQPSDDTRSAAGSLKAFIHEVQAQSDKKIAAGDAARLINQANALIGLILNPPAPIDSALPFEAESRTFECHPQPPAPTPAAPTPAAPTPAAPTNAPTPPAPTNAPTPASPTPGAWVPVSPTPWEPPAPTP